MSRPSQATPLRLAALIMAAGESRRFGECKLLRRMGGISLIGRTLSIATRAEHRFVVTGAYAEAIAEDVATSGMVRTTLLPFADWGQGLGASLGFGVGCIPEHFDAVLVLLADQALLQPDDVQALVNAWQACPNRIVCAEFAGTRAVPAIFPRAYWPRLLQLKGDQGARRLLRDNPNCIALPLARAAFDIDTPADWRAYCALQTENNQSAGTTSPGRVNGEF